MTTANETEAHVQELWKRVEAIEAQLGPALKRAADRFRRIDPETVYDDMMEVADRFAEANYLADMCEAARDKAFDTAYLQERSQPGGVEACKARAQLSEAYQSANAAWIGAKRVAHRAKLEWAAVTTKLEFVRTLETSLREQARNIDKMRG